MNNSNAYDLSSESSLYTDTAATITSSLLISKIMNIVIQTELRIAAANLSHRFFCVFCIILGFKKLQMLFSPMNQ